MTYTPDADDATQPTDAVIAKTAAAEFRALKTKANALEAAIGGAAVPLPSFRNRLYNGCFRVTSKGTLFTGKAAQGLCADHWWWSVSAQDTGAYYVEITDSTADDTSRKALQGVWNSAPLNGYFLITQRLEAMNTKDLVGTAARLSCNIATAASAGVVRVDVECHYANALDNWTAYTRFFSGQVAGTGTTYENKTVNLPVMPAQVANGLMIIILVTLTTAPANFSFALGSVQVEKGVIKTDFEYRPLTIETQLCRRYFRSLRKFWSGYGNLGDTVGDSETFHPPMRAVPLFNRTSYIKSGAAPNDIVVTFDAVNLDYVHVSGILSSTGSYAVDATWDLIAEL